MDFSASNSASLSTHTLAFFETLLATLPARSVSDRTCYRRLAEWLRDEIRAKRLTREIVWGSLAGLGAACVRRIRLVGRRLPALTSRRRTARSRGQAARSPARGGS